MDSAHVNWLAVIVASVTGFFVGGLWYSPAMFAKTWMDGFGISETQAKHANKPRTFGLGLLAAFVIATTMAVFMGPNTTLGSGAFWGAHIGFMIIMPAIGIHYLFEQRPLKLWLVNGGYVGVMATVMGAILGAWH